MDHLIDQVRHWLRRRFPVRAAVGGDAEQAAPAAHVTGDKPVIWNDQLFHRVAVDGGQASGQADRGRATRRRLQDPGGKALGTLFGPPGDDGGGQVTDPGRGEGVRIGGEASREGLSHRRRQAGQEFRDAILMPADDQRLLVTVPHDLLQESGRVAVVMAGQLDHPLLDAVGVQAVPAAETRTGNPGRGRCGNRLDFIPGDGEYPCVPPVHHGHAVGRAPLQGRQQRPDMRPGREHRSFRELATQRQRLEQAKIGTGENRHAMTEPVAAVRRYLRSHRAAVLVPKPPAFLAGRPASCRRHESTSAGRQAAQFRRIHGNGQVKRQNRRLRGVHPGQLVGLGPANHHAPPPDATCDQHVTR